MWGNGNGKDKKIAINGACGFADILYLPRVNGLQAKNKRRLYSRNAWASGMIVFVLR